MQHLKFFISGLAFAALLGCGQESARSSSNIDSAAGRSTFQVQGSVSDALVEAFGTNGSYYSTTSLQTRDGQSTFVLILDSGINYYLALTRSEQSSTNSIKHAVQIYNDQTTNVHTVFTAPGSTSVDLGDLTALAANRQQAKQQGIDGNDDGLADSVHRMYSAALTVITVDSTPTSDSDYDGIHNSIDSDYQRGIYDSDADGLADPVDANPQNSREGNRDFMLAHDRNQDGYIDDDRDGDGYFDDDLDQDGYRDGDIDQDGFHDDDDDRDGVTRAGEQYLEVYGSVTVSTASRIFSLSVRSTEYGNIATTTITVDATASRLEGLSSVIDLPIGAILEVEGAYDSATNVLRAYEVEYEGSLDGESGQDYTEVYGIVSERVNQNTLIVRVISTEYGTTAAFINVDVTSARLEGFSSSLQISVGDRIEVEGRYNPGNNILTAFEVERE